MKPVLKIVIIGSILILGGAFVFLYKYINPSDTVAFPSCPTYTYFHFYCPGCGSQRAVHQLLNLDIIKAWEYNPLLIVLLPFLLYALGVELYNFIFDKKIRIKLFYNNIFVWTLFVVVVLYFIFRNIPLQGLEFLQPPK